MRIFRIWAQPIYKTAFPILEHDLLHVFASMSVSFVLNLCGVDLTVAVIISSGGLILKEIFELLLFGEDFDNAMGDITEYSFQLCIIPLKAGLWVAGLGVFAFTAFWYVYFLYRRYNYVR